MLRALVLTVSGLLSLGNTAHAQEMCSSQATPQQLEERVAKLLAQMTPAEKVAQLQDRAPAIPRLGLPAYNWWNEGLHGIARNGYATVFPQAIGMAATWDPELLGSMGSVVSIEARAKYNTHYGQDSARYAGLTVWSPNINIFRDPRWGRGQETYGEDPYLTGLLGTHFVQGIQGNDPFYMRADATPKHFAVHSGPERIRDGFNSVASAHDLADTYLVAFHAVLTQGHAAAMMCSYNRINGTPACASPLLSDTVRGDWGFGGYIVSDCDAVGNFTHYHHWTADDAHGSAAALKGGTDLDCGDTYDALNAALSQKLIEVSDLDRALGRLMMARLRLGIMDAQSCGPYGRIDAAAIDSPAHRALALQAAEESIVLLKNDGALPLKAGTSVAVIGPTADLLENLEGNYHGTALHPVTPLDGFRAGFKNVQYAQGSSLAEGAPITIPRTALRVSAAPGAAEGLTAEYFNSAEMTGKAAVTRIDERLNLDWNRATPAPAVTAAVYSARWHGVLVPPAAGSYTLHVGIERCWDCKTHDGYKLFLGDKLVLDRGTWEKGAKDDVTLDFADTQPKAIRLEVVHSGLDEGVNLEWQAPAEAQLAEAVAAAAKADVIVATVGLSPNLEGEALQLAIPGFDGGDRTELGLPAAQRTLLDRLLATGKPVVVVLSSGSAVALEPSVLQGLHAAAAVLDNWYGGEAGGTALARVIAGVANPSGRLPVTIYRSAKDLPEFTDYSMAHRTYRYYDGPVEFPFGYGLSYSSFAYSGLSVSAPSVAAGENLTATVTLRNTSSVSGSEVAELYLVPPDAPGSPKLTLRGTQRAELPAHGSKQLTFTLTPQQLSLVDEAGKRAERAGEYTLYVGGSQPVAGNTETGKAGTQGQTVHFTITGEQAISH